MEVRFAYDGINDGPPVDDVCPICLDEFIVPAKANCGHWYCANCILQLWTYRGGFKICKCPKCISPISKLMVEASFFDRRDEEVVKVMERVTHYNCLYLGGRCGHSLLKMSQEDERRLIWALILGYFAMAVSLTLIVVLLSCLHFFISLPHDMKENILEWLWWLNLVNKILFQCLPNFIMMLGTILRIANGW